MSTLWDLVVVGAGPAGSTAALAALDARPDARVLLVDRDDFPRDKACGDGIAPHALDVVAGLGAHGPGPLDLVRGYAPVSRLELGRPGGPQVAGDMARPAHVVPRRVLDERLVRAAVDRGAALVRHRVRALEQRPGEVVLDGRFRARAVVAADGAGSVLRRAVGVAAPDRRRTAVAIRGYAPVDPARAGAQVITFAPTSWPAYAWSFPVGDGLANVGYGEVLSPGRELTRADLLDRLEVLLPGAGRDAEAWRAHLLPLSTARTRQPDGRVLLAGDAAALINPLTGEGIYYAVLSGALAGRAAVTTPSEPGAVYRRALRRRLGRHLAGTDVVAALTRSPRVVDAGIAAAGRRREVFDTLVEVGLGDGVLTPRAAAAVLAGAVRRRGSQPAEPSRAGTA